MDIPLTLPDALPATLRVLVADDHDLILEIVALVLGNTADIIPHTARSVDEVADKIALCGSFDLILLDLDMPGMLGAPTLRSVRRMNAGKPVGIFTGGSTPALVAEMDDIGAAGVIPKTISIRSLVNAIRFMAAGERYFPPELWRCAGGTAPVLTVAPELAGGSG